MSAWGVAALVACCVAPQDSDPRIAVLDGFFDSLASRGQFNGAILIAEGGQVLYRRAVGVRSPVAGDSLDVNAQFRLASASMPFTALAILQLNERALVRLDDPVERYIPEWPYEGMTLRHFLNHTSGVPNHRELFDSSGLVLPGPLRIHSPVTGNAQMMRMLAERRPAPHFPPGDAYAYSDTGYNVLAVVIERVTGMPYHRYLREEVFLPAGMDGSYAVSPARADPLEWRAEAMWEAFDGSGLMDVPGAYDDALEGSSGVYSTVDDLFRWDRALYTDRLALPETLEASYAPGVLNNGDRTSYGFGWSLYDEGAVSHDGYAAGYGVWIHRHLETQNTIIILTNSAMYLWGGVIQGLRNILEGQGYELPKLNGGRLLGRTLVTDGPEAARALYDRLSQDPDSRYEIVAMLELDALGNMLRMQGHEDEALFVFELNAAEHPDVPLVWLRLGLERAIRGDTARAVGDVRRALTIDAGDGSARRFLDGLLGR